MSENRFIWLRREATQTVRLVMKMHVEENIKTGRLIKKWVGGVISRLRYWYECSRVSINWFICLSKVILKFLFNNSFCVF